MAYQKVRRNKGPRYISTGAVINPQAPGLKTAAHQWNTYLKGEMKKLQNRARQEVFKTRPYLGKCVLCGETDTSWFYLCYDSPPQIMALCQSHHKEYSQMRGSIYEQLVRHGLEPISWEEWKNGLRLRPPGQDSSKG